MSQVQSPTAVEYTYPYTFSISNFFADMLYIINSFVSSSNINQESEYILKHCKQTIKTLHTYSP